MSLAVLPGDGAAPLLYAAEPDDYGADDLQAPPLPLSPTRRRRLASGPRAAK
jgi:hypothetical protein